MFYLMMIDTPEEKRDFVLLYERYRFLMMKIAADILGDEDLAEDAVQEAFIKVAKNMRNINRIESLATKRYLITITKRSAIDIYRIRKKQMEKEVYVDELDKLKEPLVYEGTEVDNEVLELLKNLPVKYRDIFLLKYSSHLTNTEISKVLGISEDTVRQRIVRGKHILQEEIRRWEEGK